MNDRGGRLPAWFVLFALLLLLSHSTSAHTISWGESGAAADLQRIHPVLRRMLLSGDDSTDFLSIIIEWRRMPGADTQAVAPDKLTQRQMIITTLQDDTTRQTATLLSVLDRAAAQGQVRNVRSFWISPVIALDARREVIAALAQHPDVVQVRPDARIELPPTTLTETAAPAQELPWHLAMINVGQAQHALGLDGSGVVVANLDTGVDWQHPALLTKYRGYRGRFPPIHYGNWHVSTNEGYIYPGDGHGHGTHTMGTLVGDDGAGHRVGVAPGARWIAVKIFNNAGYTLESWVHDAFQWIMAPEGNAALAPDIVNNSWGSDVSSDQRFRPDVIALRAAGILPIFAAGNNGPFAATVNSPASFPEAFAVGAVDDEKLIARFSSRGPSPWGEIKPEVVAPGVNIVSSFPGGGYRSGDGTSMAAPQAAGIAALLLQADPTLNPAQLEAILQGTAEPLDAAAPSQVNGWGLVNAYAAGMRVTASGEIVGQVRRTDGAGIANATVRAVGREFVTPIVVRSDATGAFTLSLRSGLYDLTAQAFSFSPVTVPDIEVTPGSRTPITFALPPSSTGAIFGRVTDQASGAPLAATIKATGTPAIVQTDPATGLYSLTLPPGDYDLVVTADAHRMGRRHVALAAGVSVPWDIALPEAPRILLVDSGRWYYESQAHYFADALDALDYPADLWPIRDPYGMNTGIDDRPRAADLAPYDTVIWSAPSDSPGLIGLGADLLGYLQAGGHLLVSGEDIAYWDGGGSAFDPPALYLTHALSVRFSTEGNLEDLVGVANTPFAGLSLALNTPDSARQQIFPDAATVTDKLSAAPALVWPDGAVGGVTAGVCRAFRAGWLGFGLEGAGPRAARIDALGRFLDWFSATPLAHRLVVSGNTDPLIGLPGTVITQAIALNNVGSEADLVHLLVDGGPWPFDLTLPDGSQISATGAYTVAGCAGATLTASITIPPNAPRDMRSIHVIRFLSQAGMGASTAFTLTAKTPAPLLLVDDERWYHYENRYTTALDSLGIGYDRLVTDGNALADSANILPRYPMVVWWTGYDWHLPLAPADQTSLAAFLDNGGRLLLSSQDLMDVNGRSAFVKDRLGVVGASYSITTTEVAGIIDGPLGDELGPWTLSYPFRNWSDGLRPDPAARATLHDEHLYTVGVARPADAWRTAFFAFPIETLDLSARRTLLGRTLLWLSPLGESRLQAPTTVASDSRIPVTLTLGLADIALRDGLAAALPLPPETTIVPGSVHGPWAYNPEAHTLAWAGALAPGVPITLAAELQLVTGIPAGTILPLTALLHAGDGMTFTAEAPVQVEVPWLTLTLTTSAEQTQPGDILDFELAAANAGTIGTTAWLTGTLPTGLTVIPGSASASLGDVTSSASRLMWMGILTPGASATIRFRAAVTLLLPGTRLVTRADLTDDRGRRAAAWAVVHVPARIYLPLVLRGVP